MLDELAAVCELSQDSNVDETDPERSSSDVPAVFVLIAESDPARLRELLEVAGDARVFVIGARTADAALRVLEREDVDLVLVSDDFDHGRAVQVARAGTRCPCVLLTHPGTEPASDATAWFARFIVRPVTRDKVAELVAWRQAQ